MRCRSSRSFCSCRTCSPGSHTLTSLTALTTFTTPTRTWAPAPEGWEGNRSEATTRKGSEERGSRRTPARTRIPRTERQEPTPPTGPPPKPTRSRSQGGALSNRVNRVNRVISYFSLLHLSLPSRVRFRSKDLLGLLGLLGLGCTEMLTGARWWLPPRGLVRQSQPGIRPGSREASPHRSR